MEKRRRGLAAVVTAGAVFAITTLLVTGVIQPVGAHVGSGANHLWQGHISKMNDPGTINQNKNPVHWTKLKGVPGGFADGKDMGVANKVGFGLRALPAFPGKALHVRTDKIQRRVTGTCTDTNQAVRRVNQNGSVGCTTIRPVAFEYSDEDIGPINSESFRSVGSLQLNAGVYAIWAKLGVDNRHTDEDHLEVKCQLVAGTAVDRASIFEDPSANMISMQLVAADNERFKADVECVDFGTDARAWYLRIMAMPLNLDLGL